MLKGGQDPSENPCGSTPVVGRNPASTLIPTQVSARHPGCPGQGEAPSGTTSVVFQTQQIRLPLAPLGSVTLGKHPSFPLSTMRLNLLSFLLVWAPVPPPLKRGTHTPGFPPGTAVKTK